MQKDKYILLKVSLVFPYWVSFTVLLDLINIWKMKILFGGTKRRESIIGVRDTDFKKIWGHHARKGEVEVPEGTQHFIESVTVIKD